MAQVTQSTLDEYKKLFSQNPMSQIFVLLADGLRETGKLHEALSVSKAGVQKHPRLSSGLVIHARVLVELKKFDEAYPFLQKAKSLSPDNILAHQLLGEVFIHRKEPKEALAAFKRVLFLNPQSERAQKIIGKLESLTADEYEEEVFQIQPVQAIREQIKNAGQALQTAGQNDVRTSPAIARIVSLCDAFLARDDFASAYELITEAMKDFGEAPALVSRRNLISSKLPQESANPQLLQLKRLKHFLKQIQSYQIAKTSELGPIT
jgi:tetratricopeptide (TPR) repeat protein